MSSLDKFPEWNSFEMKDMPGNTTILSPSAEIASDLQRFAKILKASQDKAEAENNKNVESAVPLAIMVYKFDLALKMYESKLKEISEKKSDVYKHLRVLKDQMIEYFIEAGFEIIEPIGLSFEDVADSVYIQHWRHDEKFSSEVVDEVLNPIIKHNGRVVEFGRVIMGAPPEQAIDA